MMAKLYFRYGSMASSKTANLLIAAYNYSERGQKVIILKPDIDNRDGLNTIRSRIGIEAEVDVVKSDTDIYNKIDKISLLELKVAKSISCILIDEAQFLNKGHIEQLCRVVDELGIPVICYGLRCDFQGNLFEGSKWLMAWADSIEELKAVCFCGKKATFNARTEGGKVIKEGKSIQIGGNDSYISLCRKHWKSGEIS